MMGYSPQLCPMYPRIEVCLNHLEPLGSEMTEKDVRLKTSDETCVKSAGKNNGKII